MGRPSLGDRKQVNVRLPVDLIGRIDAARSGLSRDRWIEKAAELALRPTAAIVDPELHQQVHVCEYTIRRGSRASSEGRFNVMGCECGATVEVAR